MKAIKPTHIQLKAMIIDVLRTIYDPELPVNIYDLGLIYEVEVDAGNNVSVVMTLTTPNCPVAEILPAEVQQKIASLPGIAQFDFELTFDPPWNMDYMTDETKLELGML